MKMKNILYTICFVMGLASCNYLDVEPVGKVIPEKVTEFRALMVSGYNIYPQYKYLLALRSDEVHPTTSSNYTSFIPFAIWQDNSSSAVIVYPWGSMYTSIFYANSVIADVMNAKENTDTDSKEQLMGEALLLRAFSHFDLLNLYGKPYESSTATSDRGIPLSTRIDIEQVYEPASVEEVYTRIFADIKEGGEFLQVDEQSQNVRYRFSKKSAKAFEARVRLYHQEWDKALELTEELMPTCPLENLNDPSATSPYYITSKEAILSLEKVGSYDMDNYMFIRPELLDKYNLTEDARVARYFKIKNNAYASNKGNGNNMKVSLRSGEIYLIAAEAAAHVDGKLNLAKTYLKQLMENRLSPVYYQVKAAEVDGMNQADLIHEIADERARELALEGHRWFDLRRTTRPQIEKSYVLNGNEATETLLQNDPRYTITFPKEATENNPNLQN